MAFSVQYDTPTVGKGGGGARHLSMAAISGGSPAGSVSCEFYRTEEEEV